MFLVRKKDHKKLYALKAIDKEWVLLQRELEHTRAERDILVTISESNHPFLISLHYSFQSENELYLVLDYCQGGDLASQVIFFFFQKKIFFLFFFFYLFLDLLIICS